MKRPQDLRPDASGKVRDLYDLGGDRLLMVASDRISAFDVVLPDPIPHKGEVLTKLSLFWFDKLRGIVPNHLLSSDVGDLPPQFGAERDRLRGRSMIVRRADVFPVECIVRGYLAGSGWKEYREAGTVCGEALLPGLKEASLLPEPIFTPSTKAADGHDVNIPVEEMLDLVGEEHGSAMTDASVALYSAAREHAAKRGVVIADTKFEFGLVDGVVTLVDEVLTPDSSRFWPAEGYEPGRPQPSFDKQYVRDWLEASGWDKEPPAPALPAEVVARTGEKYVQAYELITGRTFVPEGGS
ncbi:MAG: phosphoribosylaminoimidazolesuccinocarboxamide synthase [Coriobacteriia bacterium]|nr:phosphoribosylaminoimidazolesuccinocarboxamide synthase [Coriobacteriia bacterium]